MFHQGDLQSGIALAIQQAKSVACFVRDDNAESDIWEHDWLQDEDVSSLLAQSTVLLRMQEGSTEAGFLAAFCPLTDIPTLVVIHNGQLREHLTGNSDLTKEEFTARLQTILSPPASDTPESSTNTTPPDDFISTSPASSTPQPATSTPTSTPTPNTNISSLLPDRAARLEKDKAAKDAAAATARAVARTAAKGKAKALDAEIAAAGGSSSTKAAQLSAAAQARKRKEDEKSELRRVQALIENDKAARRARDEERRRARRDAAGGEAEAVQDNQQQSMRQAKETTGKRTRDVHLNIRLFDGGTIRASFPATATLQAVREWIDAELASVEATHPPYTFKHLLPPAPSRALSASDEAASLADVDLAPSATLVLVPVVGYTEAYAGAGGSGLLGAVVGGARGVLGSAVGAVGGVLGYVTGYGAGGQAPEAAAGGREGVGRTMGGAGGEGRVRTLADQRDGAGDRAERDQDQDPKQFYNGNQTNFEPRRDEGKDD